MNLRAAEYTISVPDDFEIVSYTINFKTNNNAAITAGATSQEYTKANGLTFTAEEVNTKESSFNLSIDTGRYIQVTGIYMILKTTDENTTEIDERKGENEKVKGIYDLQGRKIEKPTKGIYIINGKKTYIK